MHLTKKAFKYIYIVFIMFRTSGFPEYSPRQQKIYDQILSIIAKSFASYNYDHIWTPAVEKNTILVK